jgi:hypothetical protein
MSAPPTSTAGAAEILALELRAQSFVPEAEARRPSTFLSLAPTLSASYPTRKPSTPPKSPESAPVQTSENAIPAEPTAEVVQAAIKVRRSSSSTSDGSASGAGPQRFLKLGPVHWGEGDGTGDWSELSIAE